MNIQNLLDKALLGAQKYQQQLAMTTLAILVSLTGYYIYNQRQESHIRDASLAYYKILSDKDSTQAAKDKALTELTKKYKSTIYAQLGYAKIAKLAHEERDYQKAIQAYKNAMINCKSTELRDVFKLRIAKLQVLAKQPQQALNTLKSISNPFGHAKDIITTDAYIQLANYQEAEKIILEQLKKLEPIDNSEKKLAYELFNERLTLIKNEKK